MKTLIKKLNQVNKNVYSFIFILGLLLTFSSNLKAEFDTVWTKNDYRIVNKTSYDVAGFLNDSIVVLKMQLGHHPDSTPRKKGLLYYDFIVNYNINSMTYTDIYEGQNHTFTYKIYGDTTNFNDSIYVRYILSKDKSKIICTKLKDNYLHILNTNDGSLDTIINIDGMVIFGNSFENMYNGKVSFLAEATDSLTKYGFKQLYIGEIDLANYSINTYKHSSFFDHRNMETYFSKSYIIKSTKNNASEQFVQTETFKDDDVSRLYDMIYDSLKVSQNEDKMEFVGVYDPGKLIDKLSDDKYLLTKYPTSLKILTTDSLRFHGDDKKLKKYIYHPDTSYYYLGKYDSLNLLILKKYFRVSEDSIGFNIINYNYETDEYLEELHLNLYDHPFYEDIRNERSLENIFFQNDTTAYSIIGGTIIKYYIDFSENSNTFEWEYNNETYQIYPNPAGNHLNILSEKRVNNIKIVDVLGREVFNSNSNSKQIDVSFLETEIYYIIINQKHTLKFIKE